MRVWDCHTGAEVAVLRHSSPIEMADFSPDGALIVTATQHGVAHLWDARTGREVIALPGKGWIWSASFSSDGARIVTSSSDKTARVWDVASGREITILSGHEEGLRSAAFSADGAVIVTAGDKTARVWDARIGREIATLRHFGHVHGAGREIADCAVGALLAGPASAPTANVCSPPLRIEPHGFGMPARGANSSCFEAIPAISGARASALTARGL